MNDCRVIGSTVTVPQDAELTKPTVQSVCLRNNEKMLILTSGPGAANRKRLPVATGNKDNQEDPQGILFSWCNSSIGL